MAGFELTLDPSFPGAPSGPFAPWSPCRSEMTIQPPVTEAIVLSDAMTLKVKYDSLYLPWLLGYRQFLSLQAYLADQGGLELLAHQMVQWLPEYQGKGRKKEKMSV